MDKKHFQDDSPPTNHVDEVQLKYQNVLPFRYFRFANIHQQPKQATLFFWVSQILLVYQKWEQFWPLVLQ